MSFEAYSGNCWLYTHCLSPFEGQTASSSCFSGGCELYVSPHNPPPPSAPFAYQALPGVTCSYSAAYSWTSNGLIDVSMCASKCDTTSGCVSFEAYSGNCWVYSSCDSSSNGQTASSSCSGGSSCKLYVRGVAPPGPPPSVPTDASGVVRDSQTGSPIAGVTVTLTCSGHTGTATTSGEGVWSITGLVSGVCTCSYAHPGSIALRTTMELGSNASSNQQLAISLSPNDLVGSSKLRFVLSWGATPPDLDAHLVSVSTDGTEGCEVYYKQKTCSDASYSAHLDVDARQGFGPETITLEPTAGVSPGISSSFVYKVYRYSDAGSLYNSAAHVDVYNASGLLRSVAVPAAYQSPPETCGPRYWTPFTAHYSKGRLMRIQDHWQATSGVPSAAEVSGRRLSEQPLSCPVPWLLPGKAPELIPLSPEAVGARVALVLIPLLMLSVCGICWLKGRQSHGHAIELMKEHSANGELGQEMSAT